MSENLCEISNLINLISPTDIWDFFEKYEKTFFSGHSFCIYEGPSRLDTCPFECLKKSLNLKVTPLKLLFFLIELLFYCTFLFFQVHVSLETFYLRPSLWRKILIAPFIWENAFAPHIECFNKYRIKVQKPWFYFMFHKMLEIIFYQERNEMEKILKVDVSFRNNGTWALLVCRHLLRRVTIVTGQR